jgi:NosR/NirI family nitrous oxide reductase transcriptional regulator
MIGRILAAVAGRCFGKAIALVLAAACLSPTSAGTLTREQVQRRFKLPYEVGEKLADLPVWPVTSTLEKEAGAVAYAYETIDITPLPGFEGSPMNFLVTLDRKGEFVDVELLSQREPVFTFRDLGGYGDTFLRQFIAQYTGKNLNQPFIIATDSARKPGGVGKDRGGVAMLDGVAKATTSIRIVNQTVLTSALAVARAKLGFVDRGALGPPARVRRDEFERVAFAEMLDKGMIRRLALTNRDVEMLFRGTDGAGADEEALARPDDTYADLYVAYLNAPTIGRALLGDEGYKALMDRNFDNLHLWWIGVAGRYQIVDDDFVPGAQSPRLALRQAGGFLDFRDQGFENLETTAPVKLQMSRVFGLRGDSDVDPGSPVELIATLTRAKGQMLPTFTHQQVMLTYTPPPYLFSYPPKPIPEWLAAWKGRWIDISVIAFSLALLTAALARPRWLVARPGRLRVFRLAFLAFTLVFLGWRAQGQLSIVQVTGALKSLSSGGGLTSYLYDPVSLLLIGFTVPTFAIWGRGTFCGWLCPFGALQEFVGLIAEKLRLPQVRFPAKYARKIGNLRYVVLALLAAAAVFAPTLGESLNAVEPFKTSITLGFNASWPFVAYALTLLSVAAFYFKFFCRFICPLGAAMSIGGKLRLFDWIARRPECGKPCQLCKIECRYDAIKPTGEIRYDACFQCLDCVKIYNDVRRCVPAVLYAKRKKTLIIKSGA